MWTRVVTKNINLASVIFRRCNDEIAHIPLRLESSFYDGSRKKLQLFSKARDSQALPATVGWQGEWFKVGEERLCPTKSHCLLPSVVPCQLTAQSQPAVIHSHSLTLPDFLCTRGAVFLLCLQKPSLCIWLRKLEMHPLIKELHGFCALTVNTVWWQVKAKGESIKKPKPNLGWVVVDEAQVSDFSLCLLVTHCLSVTFVWVLHFHYAHHFHTVLLFLKII